MKKIWFLLPTALLALALGSCGGGESHATGLTTPDTSTSQGGGTSTSTDPESSSTPVSEVVYYVVGAFNGWTQADENYKMTAVSGEEDHYVFEHLALKKDQGLKCIGVGNGVTVWYPEGMGNDTVAEQDGYYDVHLHKNAAADEMTTIEWKEEYIPEGEVEYYLVGTFNEWAKLDPNYKMSVDPEDDNVYLFEGLALQAFSSKFKVMDSDNTWYGEGADGKGGDRVVAENGTYTIKFYVETPEGKDQKVEAIKTADGGEVDPVPVTSMDIMGSFNTWSAPIELAKSGNTFSGELDIHDAENEVEVKVRINAAWTYSLGATALSTGVYADDDPNIKLNPGVYSVTVTLGEKAMEDFNTDKTIVEFTISELQ